MEIRFKDPVLQAKSDEIASHIVTHLIERDSCYWIGMRLVFRRSGVSDIEEYEILVERRTACDQPGEEIFDRIIPVVDPIANLIRDRPYQFLDEVLASEAS